MDIIKFDNVSFSYPGVDHEAIKNVSLTVKKGEFLCILGHNGSGKSTFAKMINGLFIPQQGTVKVKDLDTKDEKNLKQIRATAGMVFQNPDNQMVATIVEEDVAFGCENLGVPQREIRGRVDNALKAVNMLPFAKKAPHRLSGGQKQRIAIAGILAMEPEILILDEATAMLDPLGRKEVLETAKRLNKERNITVVYITHFMEETVDADRVVVFSAGEIKNEGTPEEIFANREEIAKLTLELPEVTKIADYLKDNGIDVDRNTLKIEDLSKQLCR